MSVLPLGDSEFIAFALGHAAIWDLDPTGLGLSPTQVASFTTTVNTASASLSAAQAARDASKAATVVLRKDISTARQSAAELVRIIKGYAESQANPAAVYAQAQIPPPAAPSPTPAPDKPYNFLVVLNTDGSVTLSWDCDGAAASTGGYFTIKRRLPGEANFTLIGIAPGATTEVRRPNFTDETVPTSAAGTGVQYIIQGFRGTKPGSPSEAFTVLFGVDGSGAFNAAKIKMAA